MIISPGSEAPGADSGGPGGGSGGPAVGSDGGPRGPSPKRVSLVKNIVALHGF